MNSGDGLANIAKYQELSNSYLIKYGLDKVNGQAKLINLIGAKGYGSNMNVIKVSYEKKFINCIFYVIISISK